MNTFIKKITSIATVAAVAAVTAVSAASADSKPTTYDWSALGRYVIGAPTSVNSEPDYFSIWHNDDGAVATMSGITHTTPGASATTTIHCENYTMTDVSFADYQTSSAYTSPSVGSPTKDIEVEYRVYVVTNTVGDTVVSTGNIAKR